MEKVFTKSELLRIARLYFAGVPLGEELPKGLLSDLKSFERHFRGAVPESLQADAFLFFAAEKGWSAEEFRKMKKELLEQSEACRKHRGSCLASQKLRRSWSMCWVCPRLQDTPVEGRELMSDEFLNDWYKALERKAWKEMSPRRKAAHLELEKLKAEARRKAASKFPLETTIRGEEDEVADSLGTARTNRR